MSLSPEMRALATVIKAAAGALALECQALAALPVGGVAAPVLASPRLGVGWVTCGVVLPQGAASGAVQLGALVTQTDVKTTWPDGSIRFAVVTAKSPAADVYPLTDGESSSGAFVPVWPSASVSFAIDGFNYVAALPSFVPVDPWLTGPLVRETRVVVPALGTNGPHPLLQVVFDVRSYVDGSHRVDVTVQNVKDVTEGAAVTYDVLIVVKKSSYVGTDVVHPYLTRWRKTFTTAGFTEAEVVPDLEPWYEAGAVPRFLPTVVDARPTAQGPGFVPLGFGDMSIDMSAPGGRPEIAPYPNWTAQYLVHQRPEQRAYMLASADLSGSWRGHITEADGLTLITLDNYPDYWLDGRAGTRPAGPNAVRVDHQGGPWPGAWSWPIDIAHHPSLTYVPYLLTGDRFYLDQMKFWANFTLLATWPSNGLRQGGKGILVDNQARGIGWSIRTLADVAAYLPDADSLAAYFRTRLQNNLNYFDTMAKAIGGGFLETVFNFSLYGGTVTSLWANAYIGWALDHAEAQGFGPVAVLRDRIVRTQIAFFSSSAEGYPRERGAPYYPMVGTAAALFTTMQQVFDASKASDDRVLRDYLPEARMMLQIGAREGVPGARAALDYLLSIIAGDVNFRSGYAVLP